jgi:hypothetical protein
MGGQPAVRAPSNPSRADNAPLAGVARTRELIALSCLSHQAVTVVGQVGRRAATVANANAISKDERARRAAASEEAIASARLEGLEISAEVLADGQAYIDGEITVDELVARTRAQYGLE